MEPRTTSRPKIAPKPATDRPTGIAGLAAWFGRLPLPTAKPRQDRREAWLARREARATTTGELPPPGPKGPAPVAVTPVATPPATGSQGPAARPRRPRREASPAFEIPAAPALADLPDLAALVAAPDTASDAVPAWVTAPTPRMLFEMPGPGEAVEGQEFFRLFRANADGLSELARLAADEPEQALHETEARPWWRRAAR